MKIELRKDSMRCEPLFDLAGPFVKAGVLSTDAVQLVDLLRTRWPETSPRAALCLAFVLEAQLRGHAGLDLLEAPTMLVSRDEEPEVEAAATEPEADPDDETPPDSADTLEGPWRGAALAAWQTETLACSMFHGADAPFTASTIAGGGTLLQSRRMAWEEAELAAALIALATPVDPSHPGALVVDESAVRAKLPKLLGTDHAGTPAERALLAVAARRLTIITGGPGTGKTWSIKRALAVLLEAAADQNRPLRVVLAAPTGKAGVRMREAMGEDLEKLDTPEPIRTLLSNLESSTVHRLLKIQPGSGASRFGPKEPLPADVVVVDEASMVDLTLMRRVVKAIGPSTRLILLGDRDQLPSVDVGSVLSDIVRQPLAHREGQSPHAGPIGDCVVRFDVNHRSGAAPALAELVSILQDDRSESGNRRAIELLSGRHVERDTLPGRLRTLGPPQDDKPTKAQLDRLLAPWLEDTLGFKAKPADKNDKTIVYREANGYLTYIAKVLKEHGRAGLVKARPELLKLFDRYRLLAVHRRGPLGVAGLTKELTPLFQKPILDALVGRPVRDEKGGKRPPTAAEQTARRKTGLPTARGLWLGQPVLVTQNAYDVNLWNGDIGLVLPAADDTNRLEVVFPPAEFAAPAEVAANRLEVVFPPAEFAAPAEVAAGSKLRTVAVSRLPEHTSGLVLTVHKSQGSQYAHVGLVLAAKDSPIQTRELVYTGITRASERVTWLGQAERLDAALNTVVRRGSALAERLSPDAPPAPRSRGGRGGAAIGPVAAVAPPPSVPGARNPFDRAVAAVLAACEPIPKKEILLAASLTDAEWTALRGALEARRDIVRMGIKRGARYTSEAVYEALILAAVAENDTGEGVLKGAIESHLEAKWGPAEDDAWGHAIERLKQSGRVVKSGAAKGTRYRVG